MQLRRVVIGVDFGAPSVAAAEWTSAYFAHGAELVLVHVLDLPRTPRFLRGRLSADLDLEDSARDRADARLRRVADGLGTDALVRVEVRTGRAPEQIAALASELDADLIAVGRHGERPGVWSHLGSTADYIVRCSHRPVLVAAGGRELRPNRFLVALDESSLTPWVIRWTHFLATRLHATVSAVHVVSSAVMTHVLTAAPIEGGDRVELSEDDLRRDVTHETDRWMRKLLAAGLHPERIDSEVAFGEPAQEIIAAAQRLRADLIIVGARGNGAAPPTILGGVVRDVLRQAPCPVLVVPEPDVPHPAA